MNIIGDMRDTYTRIRDTMQHHEILDTRRYYSIIYNIEEILGDIRGDILGERCKTCRGRRV